MFSFKQYVEGFLSAPVLNNLISGVQDFEVSFNHKIPDLVIPPIKRLGKRTEFIFEQLLKGNENIELLASNIQLKNSERTIGEIDYLLRINQTQIHLELATKLYLLDESIDDTLIKQWIGPNRKDFLHLKKTKLEKQQFPIINTPEFIAYKKDKEWDDEFSSMLLLKTQLFTPFNKKVNLPKNYNDCIVGEWIIFSDFKNLNDSTSFFIPEKKDWFITPSENKIWHDKTNVLKEITEAHNREFSPMVWSKENNTFKKYMVVWW